MIYQASVFLALRLSVSLALKDCGWGRSDQNLLGREVQFGRAKRMLHTNGETAT